jgi:hypothetical protein
MGKMFPQGVFLELDLGIATHVLKAATTTQVGKLAGGSLATGGSVQNLFGTQFVELASTGHHFRHHGFAWQGAIDKLGFAVLTGNTPAIMAQGFNLTAHGLFWKNLPASSAHTWVS